MSAAAGPGRRVVAVLGMHRGGTSLAARAVHALGFHFGDNLWGPREDNPTGFWEDRDVVELNEALLERDGLDWQSAGLAGDGGAAAPPALAERAMT